jgi:hypothetical protein
MSASAERAAVGPAVIGALVFIAACGQASPAPSASQPTVREEAELKSAYSAWRRAETCALHSALGPIAGANRLAARAKAMLDRGAANGLAQLIHDIDAEYRRIDATVDWACTDPRGLGPEAIKASRLARLKLATDRLSRAIEAAIAPN